jgi:hypothetical protein
MGNAPSAHQGRDSRLGKDGKLKPTSPDPPAWPFSATPMAGSPLTSAQEQEAQFNQVPIASILQQRFDSSSQVNLHDGEVREVAAAIGNLQHAASKESLSAYLTPKASRSQLTAPSQTSLGFDPKQIDLRTAVAILEELRKTASPDDLVALRT